MTWQIRGQYAETCNCDYLCPCILTGGTKTTHGYCIFAAGIHIERGRYNGLSLDGRSIVLVCRTKGAMVEGNFEVGLIVDEGADDKQTEALRVIATGEAGGPMANMAPLFGKFLGVEKAPIKIASSGREWMVSAGKLVDQSMEGTKSFGGEEQMWLDNTGHPAANRISVATAKKSHIHAFGLDWDQEDGRNNAHFAPIDWSGG